MRKSNKQNKADMTQLQREELCYIELVPYTNI